MTDQERIAHLRAIGSKGGKATFEKYGSKYMSEIGRKGAIAFYAKYRLVPVYTSGWGLVRKSDQKIVTVWNVLPWTVRYEEI